MMQVLPTPEGPHFIYGGKMWEIESCFTKCDDGRILSKIRFKHVVQTGIIDQDEKFEMSTYGTGKALTRNEAVDIFISDEFAEPSIKMYIKNEGTLVGKERGRNIDEIEPLELPLHVIQKLVWEAKVLDTKHRNSLELDEIKKKIKRLENNVKV
jgi:hypothetical protein